MSNSVEYEIAMNEASRREALEAFAILNKKKYTHAEVMDLIDEKTKSQKLAYESETEKLEYKLIEINENISTLLDGECYTGHIPDSVIAYFREIQNIILK
tara:strand:- start:1473 stop:1772 length:300 start_codon:yes stop_codon:yes gene_type:complete